MRSLGMMLPGELGARVGKIRRPNGQRGIVVRICDRRRRIVDLEGAHAEVARELSLRGNGEDLGVRLRKTETFVIHKEECLAILAEQRAPERRAVVVLHEVIVAHRAEGAGIHRAVAQEFVSGAVVLVRPRARDDVDLTAASAAHVGGVAAGLDLELHHGVGRGAQVLGVKGWIGVGGAIEQKEVGIGTRAADDYCRSLSGAPIKRIRLSGLRAEADMSAGNREDEVDQHAPVEREFLDQLRLNDIADARVSGAKNVSKGVDLNAFAHGADFQRNIDGQLLSHFHMNRLRDGSEAVGRGGEFVVVGQQGGCVEQAALIGGDCADGAGTEGLEADACLGDGQRLRVGDFAGDDGVVALGERE
jgi:hypothetical protein